MISRIVAGTPSSRPTHVQVGDARTASTTSASTMIPNALKTRPADAVALQERIDQQAGELHGQQHGGRLLLDDAQHAGDRTG